MKMIKRRPQLTRHAIRLTAMLLVGLLLAACAIRDGSPPLPPPPGAPVALVGPGAGGALHEHLKGYLRMVEHDGSQNVADHDLLILDGKTHSPQELAEHDLLQQALEAGTWVLVLDASEAHKDDGLFSHLGFATEGHTEAYFFRRGRLLPMPSYDVFEFLPTSASPDEAQRSEATRSYQREKFAQRVVERLGDATCTTPLDLPAGMVYLAWCYGGEDHSPLDNAKVYCEGGDNCPVYMHEGDVKQEVRAGQVIDFGHGQSYTVPTQEPGFSATFTLTLILNNGHHVTGDSQTLHIQVDGEATPSQTTFPARDGLPNALAEYAGKPYFMGLLAPYADPISYRDSGRSRVINTINGWVQGSLTVEMYPDHAEAWHQSANEFAPQNTDEHFVESYTHTTTTSVSATLNASENAGISGSYSVTNSKSESFDIAEWMWSQETVGDQTHLKWTFYSNAPKVEEWGDWPASPYDLNDLNQMPMTFGTAAVWTTCPNSACTLLTEPSTFQLSTIRTLYALDCWIGHKCNKYEDADATQSSHSQVAPAVAIDMSAVIPVTLSSMRFTDASGQVVGTESNPVTAGDTVTATVTLSGEAQFSYAVASQATSLSDNAFIAENPVTVEKGKSSFSFTIETNDNNLASGQTVAAGISVGSFGTTQTEQLFIRQP